MDSISTGPHPPTTDDAPEGSARPVIVVDAANVVGSVPDGWWRDRRGATERLRDRIAAAAGTEMAGVPSPAAIILVVEGAARGVESVPGVEVVDAAGEGDHTIVEVVGRYRDRAVTVVTSDRELRSRVKVLGARTVGPSTMPR